jgi:hypothetical protein
MEAAQPGAPPAEPDFLVKAKNAMKVAVNKALNTNEPVGAAIDTGVNAFMTSLAESGFGFAHNSFAKTFIEQAQDTTKLRNAMLEIKAAISKDGSFSDTDALDDLMKSLRPMPS